MLRWCRWEDCGEREPFLDDRTIITKGQWGEQLVLYRTQNRSDPEPEEWRRGRDVKNVFMKKAPKQQTGGSGFPEKMALRNSGRWGLNSARRAREPNLLLSPQGKQSVHLRQACVTTVPSTPFMYKIFSNHNLKYHLPSCPVMKIKRWMAMDRAGPDSDVYRGKPKPAQQPELTAHLGSTLYPWHW
jgi:hypothetical protein